MLLEPFSRVSVFGQMMTDQGPELLRVVFFLDVAKLVDDHILKNFKRRQRQQPVYRDVVMDAAAAPARFLLSDGN